MFTVDVVAGHGFMPVEVRVNTAAPVKAGGGVHVAFKVLAFGLNVPPAGVVHVPPVDAPPNVPDRVVVPP